MIQHCDIYTAFTKEEVMAKQSGLKDKVVFIILGVILLLIFLGWKGFDLLNGTGDPESEAFRQEMVEQIESLENSAQKSSSPDAEAEKLPIVKLFLGRRGVSEDQITWHDVEEFDDYIRQLQEKGVKEVHYTLLPDSIERLEEKWDDELKQANMRSYIEAD